MMKLIATITMGLACLLYVPDAPKTDTFRLGWTDAHDYGLPCYPSDGEYMKGYRQYCEQWQRAQPQQQPPILSPRNRPGRP